MRRGRGRARGGRGKAQVSHGLRSSSRMTPSSRIEHVAVRGSPLMQLSVETDETPLAISGHLMDDC